LFVEYETSSIKSYFDDFTYMNEKIGNDLTKAVKKRFDQLKASRTFGVYLSTGLGKPHRLYYDLDGYYGVSLSANIRLIIKPDSVSLELCVLNKCDSVIIKGVEDYHGKKQEWIIP
jgi:plasmid maintenance system killer protein